jgi:hypothetical protein
MAQYNMEIYLNGVPCPIYELDVFETVKSRIASQLTPISILKKTVPDLIKLAIYQEEEKKEIEAINIAGCVASGTTSLPLNNNHPLNGHSYSLIDFDSELKVVLSGLRLTAVVVNESKVDKYNRVNKNNEQFSVLIDKLTKLFNIPDIDTCINYIIYFSYSGGYNGLIKDPIIGRLFLDYINIDGDNRIEFNYESFNDNFKQQITQNLNNANTNILLFNSFHTDLNYPKSNTSEIQITETNISVKFELSADIYELFNNILLSSYIPFICVGNFYKVLKTYKPPKKWAVKFDDQNMLVLYVLNRFHETERNKTSPDFKNYSMVTITVLENSINNSNNINMIINSKLDDELHETGLLERIFSCIPYEIYNCTYEQVKIKAEYILPSPRDLDIPIFYDMVMNDPIISKLMLINEFRKTFRERGGMFIYFRYSPYMNTKDYVICKINSGIVTATHMNKYLGFSGLGDQYISVKMEKIVNIEDANRFKIIIDKILSYYFAG